MPSIEIRIEKGMLTDYPEVEVAGLGVSFVSPSDWTRAFTAIQGEISEVERRLSNFSQISDHPSVQPWRRAYANMGVKPSKFRSSIESLLRRVQKRQNVSTGLPAVDFYNAMSIIAAAPLGGYDIRKLSGRPIELRHCRPETDMFDPLGAKATAFPMKDSVVVYASGNNVLCWGFNCRDAKHSCIDADTVEAVFFSETADRTAGCRPAEVLDNLESRVRAVGGRCGTIVVVSRDIPAGCIELPA